MPDIEAGIWQKYKDQDVLVFGLYRPHENPAQLEDFREQTGVTYPFVSDVNGTLGQLAFPPGVGYPYPRDVVIGKDLTVRAIKNSFDLAEMDTLVQQLLRE